MGRSPDLAVVRLGDLVIYSNGQEVARFPRDRFPQIILDLAQELRWPTEIPANIDPDIPLS